MNNLSTKSLISPLALAVALTTSGLMISSAHAELSGNIGIHSKYVLRGIAIENDSAAIQGGLDWSQDGGGFYAGWWFSSLGYEYDSDAATSPFSGNGLENDFYAGYGFDITEGLTLDLGLTQYAYINVDDSNLTEFNASVSFNDYYAKMQYLLNDGWWGNSGDIYWTAGASFALPKDFGLAFDLGYYTYDDKDTPKYGVTTTSSSGFRNFNTTLSYPLGKSGAEIYAQYIIAGEDRLGDKDSYDNQAVVGVTYSFDM
jgi:uncharacterized protein (TIGR02001 family)